MITQVATGGWCVCYISGNSLMRPVSAQSSTGASKNAWLLVSAVFVLLLLAQPLFAQSTLRIVPLVRDDLVLVSFDLRDGYTDEVRAAIRSGLRTTFTYDVELRLDVPGWVDRTMGAATLTVSVEYDNLKRLYTMVRVLDGHTEDTLVTEEEPVVRTWLTSSQRLRLFRTSILEPNREYYVRVRATARPSNGSILWPFGSGTSAQAKFTFIR